jgi:hypothetical protein
MKGSFSDEALLHYAELVAHAQPADFSEGDTYDFTRCVRPNGSFYGTRGKCKSGTEVGAKEQAAAKPHGGVRDSTIAESRKAMKHQQEQMNMHSNQIAELEESGKKVPPALRQALSLAKASYNAHRKAINEAVGVEKRPVMQEARERGRAAEKENQAKRALQRGEESVAKAAARAKAKFNKEEMESPKNKADMDTEGLRKLMANSPTAKRKLKEEAEAKAQARAKQFPDLKREDMLKMKQDLEKRQAGK